jgi:lipopolysaccharide export system protein LptA
MLYFQEAIFHRVTNIIEGSGSIRFLSAEAQLSGDGYSYDLESGKLTLKANVVLLRSTVRVVSSNGIATIKRDEDGHKWMIQDADLLGGVQSFGIDVKGKKIDRIENDHVHYDGIKEEVILSSPIKFWSQGKEGGISGELIRYDLKKDPNKAIQPKPKAVTSATLQESRQQ